MFLKPINDTGLSYAQAVELTKFNRLVFVSGQVPETTDGTIPGDFRGQCLLAWHNVEAQLKAAGMKLNNLVTVKVYLSHRQYREENKEVRMEVLKEISPALTIVITGIYDERWLLEIEATAAE
jgi:enamine deaminase RidA (YjgF/YER057c/UK114 family)